MVQTPSDRAKIKAEAKRARQRWMKAHKAAKGYQRNLVAVAKMVAQIIQSYAPALHDGEANWQYSLNQMLDALERYSKALEPWSRSVAKLMLAEVDRRDRSTWIEYGQSLGRAMKKEIESAPTGKAYSIGMERQVTLITSLPLDAAKRVHDLATGQMYSGLRGAGLLKEIMDTGHVTKSRAVLIARTEVARASTEFTKARAEFVGSPGYIWRTAEDVDVRTSHKKLNGTEHTWDNPPICDPPNHRSHPGQIWNCRCYPEVKIPEKYLEDDAA